MESKKRLHCKTGRLPDKPLSYVIHGKDGDLLIDTMHKRNIHGLDKWIRENEFNIKYVLLTHGHYDHSWNAEFFKKKYGAKIILHKKDYDLYTGKHKKILFPTKFRYFAYSKFANVMIKTHKNPVCEIDYLIDDHDEDFLNKLGFDEKIVMLPGHTMGSIGVFDGKILYAGDACSAKGGDYYTQCIAENILFMYISEQKIFQLNPLIIAPGHGRFIINEKYKEETKEE